MKRAGLDVWILIIAVIISSFIIISSLSNNLLFKNKFAPKKPDIGIEGQETIPYPWSLYLEILENMKSPIPPITEGVPPSIEGEEPLPVPISFDIQELGDEPPLTLEPCGITPDRPIKVRCDYESCKKLGRSLKTGEAYYDANTCTLCINKLDYDELFCVNSNPNADICNKDLTLEELKSKLETIKNDINKPSPAQCVLAHEIQHIEDFNNNSSIKLCKTEKNAAEKAIQCLQNLNQKFCEEGHPDSINICGKPWQLNNQNEGYIPYCQQEISETIDFMQNKFIPFQECLCVSPYVKPSRRHCLSCYKDTFGVPWDGTGPGASWVWSPPKGYCG